MTSPQQQRRDRQLERQVRDEIESHGYGALLSCNWRFLRTRVPQLHPLLLRALDDSVWDAIGESAEGRTALQPNLVATRHDRSSAIMVVAALPQFLEIYGAKDF